MQFFDGLRSGQDRSLQISRQRCGGYNKVGGNKKSHHGRWWEKIAFLLFGSYCDWIAAGILCDLVSIFNTINSYATLTDFYGLVILIGVNASIACVCVSHRLNGSIIVICDVKVAGHFSKIQKFITILANLFRNFIGSRGLATRREFAIRFSAFRLSSHNEHTSLRNDLLLVGFVNVAGQSGDEQSGQDGQDNQDDDQLDEGEALFVFQFFEHLVFLQLFVFVPTLQDLIGISYRHFITQFVFCQAKTCCKNPFCVFLLFSSLEFIGDRALFMNFNERLRYLIDCEEIKLKDLAPKLCLSASTLSNYAQGIREPDYDTLRRIADYFGVSIDYLLGHETPAVDDERQLLTCYRSFTPSQKRFLLDQAALIKRYKIRLDD